MNRSVSIQRWTCLLTLLAVAASASYLTAQTKGPKKVRRAQPPKLAADSDGIFADAFKEALVGSRPANLDKPPATAVAASPAGTSPAGNGGLANSGWAVIISSQAIEDEIKALKLQIDGEVTSPSDFNGKGYKAARRDFSMLAMLFGIAGEYDGEVRWKKDSPAARDVFARTAANAKVGTSQVYNEAKLRKQELQDLVGGSNPFQGKDAETKVVWNTVCDRTPLMQHLEAVFDPKLKPLLNDKGQFMANIEKVKHDAEIIAAIGTVLAKDGMEDADAEEYKVFCAAIRKAAQDIVEACKTKNYDAASAGGSAIGKSCTGCHEQYRSS